MNSFFNKFLLLLAIDTLSAGTTFGFGIVSHSNSFDMTVTASSMEPRRSARLSSFKRKVTESDNEENAGFGPFTEMRSESIQTKMEDANKKQRIEPLLSMGVIADIQHAPIPDGASYGGVPRYYKHALEVAGVAAQHFQQSKVDLVLNLGDIIDGKCTTDFITDNEDENSKGVGLEAIQNVVKALSAYKNGPILHTYGNHELYNLSRESIGKILDIPFVKESNDDLVGYRSYVKNNFRFIVLDTYDIAMMGRCPQTSEKRKKAEQILAKHNPNYPEKENSPENLEGVQKRFVAFNGGIDSAQLTWLRSTLAEAKRNNERVIVLSHQPILPASSSPVCLVWNYEEVLEILREYKGNIIASFCGHAHKGGYKRDPESGIHFRVFEAVLESPHPIRTYAFVDIFENELVVRGEGRCESACYDFSHLDCVEETSESTTEASVVSD